MTRTAEHRPAARHRRFAHDDLVAVDLFSGFGGLTRGIEMAGFTTIMAANHNAYKVEVHEANHPHAEHWIADLVDPDSSDYHSARDLPAADFLVAGVSCVNHSQANTVKAYEQGLTLFDLIDPDFERRVTRSERDRATANCVLHYAERHRPRLILVECTTELASWGPAIPGRAKVGDGSTYRWWLKQFDNLGYRHQVLYLNSMFFGVPQSRDRLYIASGTGACPRQTYSTTPSHGASTATRPSTPHGRGRPACHRPARCATASSTTTAAPVAATRSSRR
jgi:site-specific DNA-cytosine methylase